MVGGAEVAIRAITDRISERDVVFDMITLRYDSSLPRVEKIGNITIYRIGWSQNNPTPLQLIRFPWYLLKVWYPIGAYFKARSLTRMHTYSTSWAMMSYMGFPALLLKNRIPRFVLSLQEGDSIAHVTRRWRIRVVGALYRRIFARADVVQCISHYLANFAATMGTPRNRIKVIPNGVDVAAFTQSYSEQDLTALRTKYHLTSSDYVLITTSRLVPKNAVDQIIHALTYLPAHVKALIVGNGPLEHELRTLVTTLKLEDRVKFAGYIQQQEIPKYLKASDIFIRTSKSEGMGNSFIEAMAAGIPVIGTRVGGIADFLIDGETGLVCDTENSAPDIARKVQKLINDRESRDSIVTHALTVARSGYDWNSIALRMKHDIFLLL